MTNTTPKIVRVTRVVDTRDYIEIGDDQWAPVPGSGIENACARCGRSHEVHAHVILDDNSSAVVGTGCARGDDMVPASTFVSAASAAKRLTQLRAQLAKAENESAVLEGIRRKVAEMTPPAPVWSDKHFAGPGKGQRCDVGDVYVYSVVTPERAKAHPESWEYERTGREECAVMTWRNARIQELLPAGMSVHSTPGLTCWELKKKITKTEKRLRALMAPAAAV